MHRPNRIGNHHIADISATDFFIPASGAEFTASEGGMVTHQVQTDTAVLGDPITTVNFNTGDASPAWPLATRKTWSFGRFVTGLAINERDVLFNYSCNVIVGFAAGTTCNLALFAGMHNTTVVTVDPTTKVNLIDESVMLAAGENAGQAQLALTAKGTFLNTIFNGGKAGEFDTNPIGLYFTILNSLTSTQTIRYLQGSLSFYRYSKDIDTFDPTR